MATKPKAATAKAAAKTVPPFPVSATSPFPDKYDIDAERAALDDLVTADDLNALTIDPRYSRYVELERREELLRGMRQAHVERDAAQSEVTLIEVARLSNQLGRLTDEEEDSMYLHTRESSRLFMGRTVEPGKQGYSQSGAKKVGAALRAVWYLSGNDNPYADFALIQAAQRISLMVQTLEAEIAAAEERLNSLKKRGLSFSILKAEPPARVGLGFRSPYGYSVVSLVSTFDYFVRVIKTLVRKDLLSEKEGYAAIYTQTKSCRSIFEQVIWYQRYLLREELRPLTRVDWLPTASEDAKKRVTAAVAIFGELPRDVFNGQVMPRHSRRRLDLSNEELRLLDEVPLAGAEPVLEAAAAALIQ